MMGRLSHVVLLCRGSHILGRILTFGVEARGNEDKALCRSYCRFADQGASVSGK